jgi:Domain of unknown function (DUF4436)
VLGLAVVVIAGALLSTFGVSSSDKTFLNRSDNAPTGGPANGIAVDAVVQTVNTENQTVDISLQPAVRGCFARDSSGGCYAADSTDVYPNTEIWLTVLGPVVAEPFGEPTAVYKFEANRPMPVIHYTEELYTANNRSYPFDKYTATVALKLTTPENDPVPFALTVYDAAGGWKLSRSHDRSLLPGYVQANIEVISREYDHQIYTVLMFLLMWALTIAGVVMAMTLIRQPHKIDAGPLTYLAALLFAFPLLRDSLPGSPALGVLFDFYVFFWVEIVVGLTLLALLVTWIRRERQANRLDAIAEDEDDLAGTAFQ